MAKIVILTAFVLGSVLLAQADPISEKPKLRGVTILAPPFITKGEPNEAPFKGFLVDLLDKISTKANFDYELYLSPDGFYGKIQNETINGMIGEVHSLKADFALADLTVTENRKAFIDFTEPFLNLTIAALIKSSNQGNLKTLEDLVEKGKIQARENNGTNQFQYGVIKNGATQELLRTTQDPIAQELGKSLEEIASISEGVKLVQQGNGTLMAIITESAGADFYAATHCDLISLPDKRGIFDRQYALVVKKGSDHLKTFNAAIKELTEDKTIEGLVKKYWKSQCGGN